MKERFFTILFFVLLTVWFSTANAQSGKLPPFQMMRANGKVYKAEELPMGKPIILIYFSPDCEHCQKMMNDFFKRPNDFKKASVVMITFLPVDKVAEFDRQYNVLKYPNLITGTEGTTFFVRSYYKLQQMPFAALYDKNGNLIQKYYKEVPLKELADKLNRLK